MVLGDADAVWLLGELAADQLRIMLLLPRLTLFYQTPSTQVQNSVPHTNLAEAGMIPIVCSHFKLLPVECLRKDYHSNEGMAHV